MNARPEPTNLGGFGAPPPAPTGWQRIAPYLATAAGGGAVVVFGLFIAQLVLPARFSPGYVSGQAGGDSTLGHLDTAGNAQINYDARHTAATAQQQAIPQMEMALVNKQLEITGQALQGQVLSANVNDVACNGSRAVAGYAADQRPVWSIHHSDAEDWYRGAYGVSQVTCGQGDVIRRDMNGQLADAVRTGGALMPRTPVEPQQEVVQKVVTINDARPIPGAAPPLQVHTVEEVYAITKPSQHYAWKDIMQTRGYIRTLPADVQSKLFAGLDDGNGDGWDVLTERAHAYLIVSTIH